MKFRGEYSPFSAHPHDIECEYCVVGGGIAGLFVAHRLAAAGRDVLMVEAGSAKPIGDWRNLDWYEEERDFTECDTDFPYNAQLSWVKGLGGGAEAWEAYTPRWTPYDFETNTRWGVGVDWPFGYEELEGDYAQAERFLGVAGCNDNPQDGYRSSSFPLPPFDFDVYEEQIVSRVAQLRWHHVPQARNSVAYGGRSYCNGIGVCNACPIQARWTPSATLLPSLLRFPNVRLATDSVVTGIEASSGGLARSVTVRTRQGGEWRARFDKLVLCAGAVETSRLLLLSKSKTFPNGFLNGHGNVGKYFMDHPVLRVSGKVPWSFEDQVQTNILASSHDHREYDRAAGSWGFLVNLNSRRPGRLWIASHLEMPPDDGNRVALSEKLDRYGRPFAKLTIHFDWHGCNGTLAKVKEVLMETASAAGGSQLAFDPFQLWACHPMGGCRIGSSAETSVVDANLKAWESGNTFILSLGVFPTGAAVNPTLTLLALGFRLTRYLQTT
jgi:choline dehydrogenase-like flavoprotein